VHLKFIDDVESFLQGKEVDAAIQQLQDAYSRFRMREARAARCRAGARMHRLSRTRLSLPQLQSRLLQQRVRLQKKLPEVKKALDTVTLLLSKQVRGCSLSRSPNSRRYVADTRPPPTAGMRGGVKRGVSADGQHLRKGACPSVCCRHRVHCCPLVLRAR
jgi:hypothetical protein